MKIVGSNWKIAQSQLKNRYKWRLKVEETRDVFIIAMPVKRIELIK